MKYTQPSFTLPAGPGNVTQEEWDAIWRQPCACAQCIFFAAKGSKWCKYHKNIEEQSLAARSLKRRTP